MDLTTSDLAVASVRKPVRIARLANGSADPGEHRSQRGARLLAGKYVVRPQFLHDPPAVHDFIESAVQTLQPALRVPDCLDVSFVVANLGTEHLIQSLSVCEIVGLQHVYQEVNRCAANLIGSKHLVKRKAVPIEDLPDVTRPPRLEIIHQNDEIVFGREEAASRQTDIGCIPIRNALAAANHAQLAPFGLDRRSLIDRPITLNEHLPDAETDRNNRGRNSFSALPVTIKPKRQNCQSWRRAGSDKFISPWRQSHPDLAARRPRTCKATPRRTLREDHARPRFRSADRTGRDRSRHRRPGYPAVRTD